MGKVKKYKRSIGHFLTSDKGQRFFNFAYSIGAAIVIWGALFKILHLPGGNTLLSIGMGTEVLMFLLSAFDRPTRDYKWERVYPALDRTGHDDSDRDDADAEDTADATAAVHAAGGGVVFVGSGTGGAAVTAGSTVVTPGQARAAAGIPGDIALSESDTRSLSDSIAKMAAASDQLSRMAELTSATQQYLEQMKSIADEMTRLRDTTAALNQVSDVLLQSYRVITENSENITRSSQGYVEQMSDMAHNLTGLNTIYEIQLKSVSSQLDSIDRVNRGIKDIRDMYEKSASQSARYCEETERMALYMHQLNSVYEKMLHAMTINMYNPMMAPAAAAAKEARDAASDDKIQ